MSPDGEADPAADPRPPEERWAHRVDPDLAAEREGRAPTDNPPVSARPPGASRYGWFVGVVALLLLALVTLNTLRTGSHGQGLPAGKPLPPFAVPLVDSNLNGDANLAARPGQGARTAACAVEDPRALNLCRVAGGAPLVLVFFSSKNAESVKQVDVAQAVARRLGGVRFAAVALRGDRRRTSALRAAHGWSMPVGFDRSGDVAARYFLPTVPSLVLAYPRRLVARSVFRSIDEAQLTADARALMHPPPARAAVP